MTTTGILCFTAYNTSFSPSSFPGIKLILSLTEPFTCLLGDQLVEGLHGLMLNRNTLHSVVAPKTGLLIYYIDGNSGLNNRMRAQLANRPWLDMTQQINRLPGLPQSVSALISTNDQVLAAQLALTALFSVSSVRREPPRGHSISKLLQYITTNIQQPITLADLAPVAQLSIDRTRHLFGEQMGMPFSQYVIWMRLKLIIQQLLIQPQLLGETARRYGFSDASHFNRHFKRSLGIRPHHFFKTTFQFLPL